MDLEVGILFGLLSMLGLGLSSAIATVPIRQLGPRRAIFYRNVFTSLLLLVPALLAFRSVDATALLWIAGISFIGYFPLLAFYRALRSGAIGIVSPIGNASGAITILLAVLLFGESLSFAQGISFAVIITGVVLISLNPADIRGSKHALWKQGIPFAILAAFGWGLVFFLLKIPLGSLGPEANALFLEFGILVWSGLHFAIKRPFVPVRNKSLLFQLFAVGLLGAAGILFFNRGIAVSDVSIVSAVAFANPLVAVLYGRFAYGERLRRLQYAAILLIVGGLTVLVPG